MSEHAIKQLHTYYEEISGFRLAFLSHQRFYFEVKPQK